MAKSIILLAIPILFLQTLAYGGSILTDEEERCAERIGCLELGSCERFLAHRSDLQQLMITRPNQMDQRAEMEDCCRRLTEVDDQCRREALQYVARKVEDKWELEGEQLQQLKRRISQLDSRCGRGERREREYREEDCTERIRREELGACRAYVTRGGGTKGTKECCNQLRRLDGECRETAIREIIEDEKRGRRGEDLHKVESRGEYLRERCQV